MHRKNYIQSTGGLTHKVQEYLLAKYRSTYIACIYSFIISYTLCYLMHSVVTYNIIYLKYWIHVKGCATLFQTGFYHSSCFKKVHLVVISWN